jgi:uncharacterized protein YbjT (DUF2867 family)
VGVERAFFVSAVDRRYVAWFGNFLTSAQRSGSPHVVKFSGMGAGIDSPSEILRQHGETDEALADSGLPYTILRPNSFYQNMLWSAGTIKDHGAFYLPMGNASIRGSAARGSSRFHAQGRDAPVECPCGDGVVRRLCSRRGRWDNGHR